MHWIIIISLLLWRWCKDKYKCHFSEVVYGQNNQPTSPLQANQSWFLWSAVDKEINSVIFHYVCLKFTEILSSLAFAIRGGLKSFKLLKCGKSKHFSFDCMWILLIVVDWPRLMPKSLCHFLTQLDRERMCNKNLMDQGKGRERSLSSCHHGQNRLNSGKLIQFIQNKAEWDNKKSNQILKHLPITPSFFKFPPSQVLQADGEWGLGWFITDWMFCLFLLLGRIPHTLLLLQRGFLHCGKFISAPPRAAGHSCLSMGWPRSQSQLQLLK